MTGTTVVGIEPWDPLSTMLYRCSTIQSGNIAMVYNHIIVLWPTFANQQPFRAAQQLIKQHFRIKSLQFYFHC